MEPVRCSRETAPRNSRRLLLLVSTGWELAVTVGLFVAAGWWLGRRCSSLLPLLFLSLAGLAVGLTRFLISVIRNTK
jgi:hypothetical protein